jgi:hypothetical protein
MTFTPERSSINQRVQVGAEATIGTTVAAGKLLECFDFVFGVTPDVTFYNATGHKYASVQEENEEWVDGTMAGKMDFNGLLYPCGGVFGAVSPVLHSPSTTANDWIYIPPITGSIAPQTYSFQQGDSVRAHKFAYGLFTQFGYTITRKETKSAGKLIGQPLSDGATLTASPTAIALAPIVGKMVNVYLDTTSAGLGTTQLLKVLSVDYSFDNVYGPFWPLNRSNLGYTAHVDLEPKPIVKLKVEADALGMALLGYLQTGVTYYLRVQAVGNVIDVTNSISNTFTHDMAIKVGKPTAFSDDSGIFAIEWECTVVEDPAWGSSGQAQKITLTNLITAL